MIVRKSFSVNNISLGWVYLTVRVRFYVYDNSSTIERNKEIVEIWNTFCLQTCSHQPCSCKSLFKILAQGLGLLPLGELTELISTATINYWQPYPDCNIINEIINITDLDNYCQVLQKMNLSSIRVGHADDDKLSK